MSQRKEWTMHNKKDTTVILTLKEEKAKAKGELAIYSTSHNYLGGLQQEVNSK